MIDLESANNLLSSKLPNTWSPTTPPALTGASPPPTESIPRAIEYSPFRLLRKMHQEREKFLEAEPSLTHSSDLEFENHRDLFEAQMLKILARSDLSETDMRNLEPRSAIQLSEGLHRLLRHLNRLVSGRFASAECGFMETSRYPRLEGAMAVIEESTGGFELAGDTEHSLFELNDLSCAKSAHNATAAFHQKLVQVVDSTRLRVGAFTRPVNSISGQSVSAWIKTFDDHYSRYIQDVFSALQHDFRQCGHESTHRVMFRLLDVDFSAPRNLDQSLHMYLYCPKLGSWCQSQIQLGRDASENSNRNSNVCDELKGSVLREESLLLLLDGELRTLVYGLDCAINFNKAINDAPEKKLTDLIEVDGFFCTPSHHVNTKRFFNLPERRALAAKLALNLLMFSCGSHTAKSWVSDDIFFHFSTISDLDKNAPHITCNLGINPLEFFKVDDRNTPCAPFTTFAKLLLEIGFGSLFDSDFDPTRWSGWRKVKEELQRQNMFMDPSHVSYLTAVDSCLKFDKIYSRSRTTNSGRLEDPEMTVRKLIQNHVLSNILENLEASLRPPSKRRRSEDSNSRQGDRAPTNKPNELNMDTETVYPAKSHLVKRLRFDVPVGEGRNDLHEIGPPLLAVKTRLPQPSDFEIAIICALALEATPFDALFDEIYEGHNHAENDVSYTTGRLGNHNIVLAHMAGIGKVNATIVAKETQTTFTNVKLALVVGICGGVPFYKQGGEMQEILLGDVIISDGILQHDFGSRYPDRLEYKTSYQEGLPRPTNRIRSFLNMVKTDRNMHKLACKTAQHLHNIQQSTTKTKFRHPGQQHDVLFDASYRHKHYNDPECDECSQCYAQEDPVCKDAEERSCAEIGCQGKVIPRRRLGRDPRSSTTPVIHFGRVASGDAVMKSGIHRDAIAEREGVIAFEMEGAGVWELIPCVVVKAVCDYSDSHKNKLFQPYAAASAAACAKALLEQWGSTAQQF